MYMKKNARFMATLLLLCLAVTVALMPAAVLAEEEEERVPDPPIPTPIGDLQAGHIGNCRDYVNLRDGPGTTYPIIGRASLGTSIELLEWDREGEWCKILLGDRSSAAWVSGQFIVR